MIGGSGTTNYRQAAARVIAPPVLLIRRHVVEKRAANAKVATPNTNSWLIVLRNIGSASGFAGSRKIEVMASKPTKISVANAVPRQNHGSDVRLARSAPTINSASPRSPSIPANFSRAIFVPGQVAGSSGCATGKTSSGGKLA